MSILLWLGVIDFGQWQIYSFAIVGLTISVVLFIEARIFEGIRTLRPVQRWINGITYALAGFSGTVSILALVAGNSVVGNPIIEFVKPIASWVYAVIGILLFYYFFYERN